MQHSKKYLKSIITAINIGNILEWYELGLFIYWAPTFSRIFFNSSSITTGLLSLFIFQGLGYAIRPLGGLFFGKLGDKIGRRKTLIYSITCMTIPTLGIAFLPSYATLGLWSPILLCIIRILQSFPSGGELPGAFCYLYESAQPYNRKYVTSWGFIGNQIGFILAILECIVFESFLPKESIEAWGWRLSFLIAALISIFGLYLRYTLKETSEWQILKKEKRIVNSPVTNIFKNYKLKILHGIGYSAVTSVSFGMLISFLPTYFSKILGTNYLNNLTYTLLILVLVTVPLTFFGKLADRYYNYKHMLLISTGIIIILLSFLHFFSLNTIASFTIFGLIALSCACLYAILPFILTDLFPASIRFTGVGLTFNIADIFEGISPVIGFYFAQSYKNSLVYYWIFIVCALISFYSYLKIKPVDAKK